MRQLNIFRTTLCVITLLVFVAIPSEIKSHTVAPPQDKQLLPFYRDGRYGYMNRAGLVVVEPQFAWAAEFSEGLAIVAVPSAADPKLLKFGFIDSTGAMKIKPQFDYASEFSDGRAVIGRYEAIANQEMRYGYIDKNGNQVIRPQFRTADILTDGLALVEDASKNFGYIDKDGNVVIDLQFSKGTRFSEGLALVADEQGMYGYIDKKGKFISSSRFLSGTRFSEGRAAVMTVNNKVGYIDRSGSFVIQPTFDASRPFVKGVAAVREGSDWKFIDAHGTAVITKKFAQALSFSEGLAAVRVDDEWGYINAKGDFVIPPQFAAAGPFNNGRALVTDGVYLKKKFIDKTGRSIDSLSSLANTPPAPFTTFNAITEVAGAGFGDDTPTGLELIKIRFESTPANATVFLVPRRVWESNPNMLRDDQSLSYYRFVGGNTPADSSVRQKVYFAVFVLNDRRIPLRIEVIANQPNVFRVSF